MIKRIIAKIRGFNFIDGSVDCHRPTAHLLRGLEASGNVKLEEGVKTFPGVRIDGQAQISIGRHTSINGPGTEICAAIHPVMIGKYCSIARQVSIQEYNHNYLRVSSSTLSSKFFGNSKKDDLISNGSIKIGNDVWIGSKVTILSGVSIGDGAIIAANSLVNKDVEPYTIAGGVPAKVLKLRFSQDIIRELMNLRWWEWSDEKIRDNKEFFLNVLTMDSFRCIK